MSGSGQCWWWHCEQQDPSCLCHAAFICSSRCFATCLSKCRPPPPWLFQGGKGSGRDTAEPKHPDTRRSIWDNTSSMLVRVQEQEMESICVWVCMRVQRGMGISPQGNGMTYCPRCISTCQPAESKERSDRIWRLASTPTSADARHMCMSAHTHVSAHTPSLTKDILQWTHKWMIPKPVTHVKVTARNF